MHQQLYLRISVFLVGLSLSITTLAATILVSNGNNDGAGSLRNAILLAQNGDQILFQGAFSVQLQTPLYLDKTVTITGVPGARITRTFGTQPFRLITVDNFTPRSGVIFFQNLVFSDGNALIGAAIRNFYPSFEVANCTFENNIGPAITSNTNSTQVIIRQSIFRNNQSDFASGFDNFAGTATLEQCDFYGNIATIDGGAIFVSGGTVHIRRCTLRGNRATNGGAIAASNATVTIVNSTITGNRASNSGAGIALGSNTTLAMHSSTINGNSAPTGGAIRQVLSSTATLVNTILWGNSSEVSAATGAVTSVSFSIVQGGFAGTGNLDVNPLFVSPLSLGNPNPEQGGNFQLQACSPAINAGTATNAPNNDLNGAVRPQFGAYDMGAYESNAIGSTGIVYVRPSASGNGTGSSWANAFTNLQAALAFAQQCPQVKQVWVVQGTYYPDEGPGLINNDRTMRFSLRNHLELYGGFAGSETLLSQRNLSGSPSILNGDIQQDNVSSNNTNSLFLNASLDSTAVLDGFTFLNGNATSAGGALSNNNASPTIRNCIFRNNFSDAWAGAVYNANGSNARFANCVFVGNKATNGGAIFNTGSSPLFMNCTMASNQAPSGSVIWSQTNSLARLTNCVVWANTGSAALVNTVTSPFTVEYSLTQESHPGTGNLNTNPLFINLAGDNLGLSPCSPAINTGIATGAPGTDILGVVRPQSGAVDMGAYESLTIGSYGVAYVLPTATGNGTGINWENAFVSLKSALAFSQQCPQVKQVWVAKGTYVPTAFTNRDSAFSLLNNVAVYGGFVGNETMLSQRNWRTNPTILSGDIGVAGNRSDNAHNVISNHNNSLDATAILDGFIITNGQADKGEYARSRGGGMFNLNSSPLVRNCIFTGNFSSAYGGAVFNEGASAMPTFINCVFSGNQALWGGGIYNESSQTRVFNCTFSSNQVANTGGGMYSYGQPLATVRNSIVWGNTNGITTAPIDNSTPIEVTHSIVQGGYTGNSNQNLNPLFNQQAPIGLGQLGDVKILDCSPALNSGNNAVLPAGVVTDLAGFPRIAFTTIDMGAYEKQSQPGLNIYLDASAKGNNEGTSWADAFTTLEAALNDMNLCSYNQPLNLLIATGTYPFSSNTPIIIENLNGQILGGYPAGGGTRNPSLNPVILKGDVQVLKNITIDGVKVEK